MINPCRHELEVENDAYEQGVEDERERWNEAISAAVNTVNTCGAPLPTVQLVRNIMASVAALVEENSP